MVSQCQVCGRILKNEPWVSMGIGRVCAGYAGIEVPKTYKSRGIRQTAKSIGKHGRSIGKAMGVYDLVLQRRPDGVPEVNIPHAIVHHSPTGFEWGYGGSGPADLALNILSAMIGPEAAREGGLYQKFKWDFIAGLPHEGGTIKAVDIEAWLKENRGGDLFEK